MLARLAAALADIAMSNTMASMPAAAKTLGIFRLDQLFHSHHRRATRRPVKGPSPSAIQVAAQRIPSLSNSLYFH